MQLGVISYFNGASFAAETRINYYNEDDFALNLWDINNFSKDLYLQSFLWPYDYEFTEGDGENINNDIFLRNPDVGPDVILDLALPNGRPGPDAYEILAFFAQSASLALGTKPANSFGSNFDLESLGLLGGSNIRANHSYQFNHDAAETWGFYTQLKSDLGFDATYLLPAIVNTLTTADESLATAFHERLDWFLQPITVSVHIKNAYVESPEAVDEPFTAASQRLAAIDDVFEKYETVDIRLIERPSFKALEISESLNIALYSLGLDEVQS